MIDVVWATQNYLFWLVGISVFCFCLERVRPWRKQRVLRRGIGQDVFFLLFNGHFFGILFAYIAAWTLGILNLETFPDQVGPALVTKWPWAAQFAVGLFAKDLMEWCVHILLHRVRWLWQFHKLHHSIEELDWIGNFRFHFGEILIYRTITFFPLLLLGAASSVLLAIAVVTTLISTLNHANVDISWGPLRYLLNSPRMHVWHHDIHKHGRFGQNYAIVFSLWDWLFGTAYMPTDRKQPDRLGFTRLRRFPRGLWARLCYPFLKKRAASEDEADA